MSTSFWWQPLVAWAVEREERACRLASPLHRLVRAPGGTPGFLHPELALSDLSDAGDLQVPHRSQGVCLHTI